MRKKINSVPMSAIRLIIIEEKDNYLSYKRLCDQFGIKEDPIAVAKYQAKMDILTKIMDGAGMNFKATLLGKGEEVKS